jgi:hypothetical protein
MTTKTENRITKIGQTIAAIIGFLLLAILIEALNNPTRISFGGW